MIRPRKYRWSLGITPDEARAYVALHDDMHPTPDEPTTTAPRFCKEHGSKTETEEKADG